MERKNLSRFEKIIYDTLVTWQENKRFCLNEEGNETFDLDELLEVIGQYGPWTSKDRELPISATTDTLSWFVKEGILKRLGKESWEILLKVEG